MLRVVSQAMTTAPVGTISGADCGDAGRARSPGRERGKSRPVAVAEGELTALVPEQASFLRGIRLGAISAFAAMILRHEAT
jgi:hypothetical protein